MPLASSHDQSVLNRGVRHTGARHRRRPLPVGKVQLLRMLLTWFLVVFSLMNRRPEISALFNPPRRPERDRERDEDQEHANIPGEGPPDVGADGLVEE